MARVIILWITYLATLLAVLNIVVSSSTSETAQPEPSGTLYTGVFLTKTSHELLLDYWNQSVGVTGDLGKIHADHMTLQYKPTKAEVLALPLGKRVSIYAFLWASDGDSCEGVQVYSPNIKSNNTYSHCTVSTSNSTGAVCTNSILERVHNGSEGVSFGYFAEPLQLYGCIDTRPQSSGKC